ADPEVVRINAGGPQMTVGGMVWAADRSFSGGKAYSNPKVTAIAGTVNDALYLTERSATTNRGAFNYTIPVSQSGTFTVRLHFAEIWHGATGGGPGGVGKRVFDVNLEGGPVELDDLDLFAEVGAMTATVKTLSQTVTDGALTLDFTASVDQPKISAIEVVYPTGTTPQPAGWWPETWSEQPDAPTAIFETAATTVGGKIYRFGGFDGNFDVIRGYSSYEPATGTWVDLGNLPEGAAESHQGISNDGRFIYLGGGFRGDIDVNHNPTQEVSDRVYRYDPQNNSWMILTHLPQARGAGVLEASAGKLHYISGNPADRVTNVGDHFVYNMSTGAWATAAPLPNPKDHMSSALIAGKIYILGGEHGHDVHHVQQKDAHVYDPGTDKWTKLADLPTAKSHLEAATFVSDGRIVMAGGQVDDFQPTGQVTAYNPTQNSWSLLSPLPVPLQGAIVQRVGNQFVIALGGEQTYQPRKKVWTGTAP
uniref:malectin domain-containing carbohydrate-binding protein n=1 Tax=Arthrobacter sp. TB 23 TaxID=494419 RepID=UPI00037342F0